MNDAGNIRELLRQEMEELDKLIYHLQEGLKMAPKGCLRVGHNKGSVLYFHRIDERDTCGTYIRKENRKLAEELAQKGYNSKLLSLAKERRLRIQTFLEKYHPEQMEELYVRMSEDRRKLITPYKLPAEQYAEQWQRVSYMGKPFKEDMPEIFTERGERVRSKSEKILADKFYMMHIPYRYEYPLLLEGYGLVYPDFTLLNCRTGEEFYLEHMGIMDDAQYCRKAIKKIEMYESRGIFPGEKLLLTFESSTTVLNTRVVDKMIEKYLL